MANDKRVPLERFTAYLFDDPRQAAQAAKILAAILRSEPARCHLTSLDRSRRPGVTICPNSCLNFSLPSSIK